MKKKKRQATEIPYQGHPERFHRKRLWSIIVNMFKYKETMIKEVKEDIMTMFHQTENVNEEIEIAEND